MKKTIKVITPVGTFTRTTDTEYTFAKVWSADRFKRAFANGSTVGAPGRWSKNGGYEVTFHKTRESAELAKCKWVSDAELIGIFEVQQN